MVDSFPENYERMHDADSLVLAPTHELLTNDMVAAEIWSDIVIENPLFLRTIVERREIIEGTRDILETSEEKRIPLSELVLNGEVSEQQATLFYDKLSPLLSNESYQRLVLYLPFEVIPERDWLPRSTELQESRNKFVESYLIAWGRLLQVHDVRANFVDGDVLEPELRTSDLPRVVKAAHLVPQLISKGLLSKEEVVDLRNNSKDERLKADLTDALLFIESTNIPTQDPALSVKQIIARSEKFEPSVSEDTSSERRRGWLIQQSVENEATLLSIALVSHLETTAPEQLIDMMNVEENSFGALILVKTIEKSIQTTDMVEAARTFENYFDFIKAAATASNPNLANCARKLLRKSHKLGTASKDVLEDLNVFTADLSAPLSKHLEGMRPEVETLLQLSEAIKAHPELHNSVFPTTLLYGSRMKGYGESDSDLDIGVFIQPSITDEQRPQIREQLNGVFESLGLTDAPIEFWLSEDYLIRNDIDDPYVANGEWTHMLFNAAWIGDKSTIMQLQQLLLPHYFTATAQQRSRHLERIEQDLLQYRLMHKGYERHYPVNVIDDPNAHLIDGSSVFWDSGYRHTATKLFINSIFLPDIRP